MPTVSIVIVNYNVRDYLIQCLQSLRKTCEEVDTELFVVDNCSTDGSVQYIREHFPEVIPIVSKRNLGFAAANNLALKRCTGKYILLLNPDTIVQEDFLDVLVDFFEETSDCGIAGAKVLNSNGSLQLACRRGFPTPMAAFGKLIGLSRLFPRNRVWGQYNLTYLDPDETNQVDAVSGACLMIRRETFERIGYLDETFFLYGEDLDWCYRAQKAGWKIYYHPKTAIVHYKGASSEQIPATAAREFYRAMWIFVQKHLRNKYLWSPLWLLRGGIALRYGLAALSDTLRKLVLPSIDVLWIVTAIISAIYIRFGELRPLPVYYDWRSYAVILGIPALLWLVTFSLNGFYANRPHSNLRSLLGVGEGMILISALTFFFNNWAFSRLVVLFSGCIVMVLVLLWRQILRTIYTRWQWKLPIAVNNPVYPRRSAVLGIDKESRRIFELLTLTSKQPFDMIGHILPNTHTAVPTDMDRTLVLGSMSELPAIVRSHHIHEVVFSSTAVSHEKILKLLQEFSHLHVQFTLIPNPLESLIGNVQAKTVSDIPYVLVHYNYYTARGRIFKRVFDIAISLFILLPGVLVLLPKIIFQSLRVQIVPLYGQNNQLCEVPVLMKDGDPVHSRLQLVVSILPILKGQLSYIGQPLRRHIGNSTLLLRYKSGIFSPVLHKPVPTNHLVEREIYYLKNYTPFLDLAIFWRNFYRNAMPSYLQELQ